MIWFILIWCVLYSVVDAIHDYAIIRKNNELWHKTNAIYRLFLISVLLLQTLTNSKPLTPAVDITIAGVIVSIIVYCSAIIWVVFDIVLNILLGNPILYKDRTSKLNKSLPYWLYIYGKLAALFYIIITTNFYL